MSDNQHQVVAAIIKRHLHWLKLIFAGFAACTLLAACIQDKQKPAGPPEKVTIALATTIEGALTHIAYEKGFFREEGLDVTASILPYGKQALQDMLEGNTDFATAAETPIMFAILNGAKISILASIQSHQRDNMIVARKDRAIRFARDLKGKRIASASGTTSDYFLQGILTIHGIERSEVEVVDMPVHQMINALAKGEIDAMAAFSTYAFPAQKRLGANAIVIKEENIQTSSYQLVSRQDVVTANPAKVKQLLRALVRAEEYAKAYPDEAQQIVADFINLDIGDTRKAWLERSFSVSLSQTLILSLEEESRWAINNKLCRAKTVPNYLDYIYLDGLRAVKPNAVKILN